MELNTNLCVHFERPVDPAAYVAKDSSVCHQCEKRPLFQKRAHFSNVGECQGNGVKRMIRRECTFVKANGRGGEMGTGRGKGITFKM